MMPLNILYVKDNVYPLKCGLNDMNGMFIKDNHDIGKYDWWIFKMKPIYVRNAKIFIASKFKIDASLT